MSPNPDPTPTEPRIQAERRRIAVVLAEPPATTAAPPGIDPEEFARTCLADTYEVLADLEKVRSGIAGGDERLVAELLWPDAIRWPALSIRELADRAGDEADELVVVAPAVPDLPGLVVAKLFKGLQRSVVSVSPERARGGHPVGCVAIGIRLPWPAWLPDDHHLGLPPDVVRERAPDRRSVNLGPDWHRLRDPSSITRLDPGLEGWERTRALLSGDPFD